MDATTRRYAAIKNAHHQDQLSKRMRKYQLMKKKHIKDLELRGNNLAVQSTDDYEVILEGPADTGKTIASLTKIHNAAWQNDNAQIAMVRKTFKSMAGTVVQTFHNNILPYPPGDSRCPIQAYGGEKRPERYIYPNGSVIWLGGMDNPDKVLSAERDIVYVNQCEELSLPDWEILMSRCTGRSGNLDDPMMLGDMNPAHPTHWLYEREKAKSAKFYTVTHRDNPELYTTDGEITPAGVKRLGILAKLTGDRKMRLFHGIRAFPEGAIYNVYNEEKHKVKAMVLPTRWPRFVGIDPFGAHIAAVWLAYDSRTNVLNVYREYSEPFGITTAGHAKNILDLSAGEMIFAWAGGARSERQARADFAGSGIPLEESPVIEVWAGIDRIINLMKEFKLVIHDSCPQLISEIGGYRRKMKDGNPTEDIENKHDYHLLDALRYIITLLTDGIDGQEEVVYNRVSIG